ncbi:MAG TPA: 3-oxoacyl-ACP synthase, partial [Chryseosolibacter sp.]
MSDLKRKLYEHCVHFLEQRIDAARTAIREAQESANDETKSSVGDKYETGRAMMQLEIEKNLTQLQEALKQKKILDSINIEVQPLRVQNGSIVYADHGNFFIAISVGMLVIEKESFAIVSAQSPIGTKLIGLKQGDSF